MRFRKASGCDGKVRFTSFDQAKKVARAQARRREQAFIPYHCRDCGGAHIGTRVPRPSYLKEGDDPTVEETST
jgi:hypothetical protein